MIRAVMPKMPFACRKTRETLSEESPRGLLGPSGELITHPVLQRHGPLRLTSKGRLKTPCERQPSLSGTERECTGRQRASQDDAVPTRERQAITGSPSKRFPCTGQPHITHRSLHSALLGCGPAKVRPRVQVHAPHSLRDTRVPPGVIAFLSGRHQQPAEAEHETASRYSSSAETPSEPAHGETDTLQLLAL